MRQAIAVVLVSIPLGVGIGTLVWFTIKSAMGAWAGDEEAKGGLFVMTIVWLVLMFMLGLALGGDTCK